MTGTRRTTPAKKAAAKTAKTTSAAPRLLAGGNPQIPKGDGNAVVQRYIDAVPDWKQTTCRELDALITAALPGVRKAVRWNSPFYGREDGWFISFHCMTRYVKVAFFSGTQLDPPPPVDSKQAQVRYLHVHEGEPIDAALFREWVLQSSRLPPTKM